MPDDVEPPALILSPKQQALIEACRKKKFVLASGPRYSTKTCGCLVALCDHAWRTDRGNIAIVAVSQSAGLDSGVWEDLVTSILPSYMSQNTGMTWVREPFVANVTKKPTCEVSNAFGNRTRIQLDSLKYEHEAEARFKGKRYSMMYISELSNFLRRKTFDVWGECLRMLHLKPEDHLFLADTNPADEGERSWIYQLWYVLRNTPTEELADPMLAALKQHLELVEFELADNLFVDRERIDELIGRYVHDQDLYNRYVKGLWIQASTNALFAQVFRPLRHVIGEIETPANPDPAIMVPEQSTFELGGGWDPGDSVNSAAVIIEKVLRKLPDGRTEPVFKILDELVIVNEDHTIDDFTQRFVEKMDWWAQRMGREYHWKHWSDRSVFDVREPRENKYYHQLIYEASGGRVTLMAAERGRKSVQQRVDLCRRLLFDDRLFVSNDKCPQAIAMFKSLRRGKSEIATIARGSPFKHVFDAIMYYIASECYDELQQSVLDTISAVREKKMGSTVVAIPA